MSGNEQLIDASKNGDLDQVVKLLSKGANVNAKADMNETALTYACRQGNVQVVKALIEKGARVNDKNSFGLTPLT